MPEALDLANTAIDRAPGDAEAIEIRADIYSAWLRLREAHDEYRHAFDRGGNTDSLLRRLARMDLDDGRIDDAMCHVERLRIAPRVSPAAASSLLGRIRETQGRIEEAIEGYLAGLQRDPDDLDASLGIVRCELRRASHVAAKTAARRVSEHHPESAAAWELLGVVLAALDEHAEAFEALERAERAREASSEDVDAYANLGIGLCSVGRRVDGVRMLLGGLVERPNANAFVQLASELLRNGRFPEGFRYYEHRWLVDVMAPLRDRSGLPAWRGQEIRGKSVLVRAEQGIGDVFQFARYLGELRRRGARVLFQPLDGMHAIAHRFDGVDEVVRTGRELADVDFVSNLLSLPLAFGTDLATIPRGRDPYFEPDAEKVARWGQRVARGPEDRRLTVGLVWAGRPAHSRDRYRSMALHQLAPVLNVPGVRFVGLQKGTAAVHAEAMPEHVDWENLGPELDDLDDAAAVVANLDLLIGVDTGLVHLAGAMGKPAWALIAEPSDFRWLEDREDSPWYPSLRLFRQRSVGDWTEVVRRVADALVERVSGGISSANSNVAWTPPSGMQPRDSGVPPCVELPSHLAVAAELRVGFALFDPDEPAIGPSLDYYGEWLQARLDVALVWTLRGATIIEAAAGPGAHAVGLAMRIGRMGHLIAYDTRPAMQRMFRQNMASHSIRHATLMKRSLAGPTPAGFTPLRETVDDLRLGRLDGLKINEGADAAAIIEGASDTLWRCRPWLMLAQEDDAALAALAARVREFGYRTWRMETPLFNPDNFNRRTDDIFGGRTVLTLIALPEESALPEPGPGCVELA